MKGGLLTGFFAVEVLQEAGFDGFGQDHLRLQPGRGDRLAVVARLHPGRGRRRRRVRARGRARERRHRVLAQGRLRLRVEIVGRAAHAGVEPERGRSAVLEAAHKTVALQALNGRWPGVTVNVGVVHGGTRTNVVPERCVLEVDVRSPPRRRRSRRPRPTSRRSRTSTRSPTCACPAARWHRPMEKKEGGAKLAALAIASRASSGSSSGTRRPAAPRTRTPPPARACPRSTVSARSAGTTTRPKEWLDLTSVVPRISLLAGLLSRLEGI